MPNNVTRPHWASPDALANEIHSAQVAGGTANWPLILDILGQTAHEELDIDMQIGGTNLLRLAVQTWSYRIVKELIDYGAMLNPPPADGQRPMAPMARFVMSRLAMFDGDAAAPGFAEQVDHVIRLLIRHGLDLDKQWQVDGKSARQASTQPEVGWARAFAHIEALVAQIRAVREKQKRQIDAMWEEAFGGTPPPKCARKLQHNQTIAAEPEIDVVN